MSDERLRTLERAWQETGSVEDEEAYLRHALRGGVLDEDGLEILSHLGHPAACRITGTPEGNPCADWDAFVMWNIRFLKWGERHALRALVAQVRLCLSSLPVDETFPAAVACNLTEAWLLCPCHDHARLADTRQRTLSDEVDLNAALADRLAHQGTLTIDAALLLLRLVDDTDSSSWKQGIRALENLVYIAMGLATFPERWVAASWPPLHPLPTPSEFSAVTLDLQDAVRAELVPWILKRGDPLEQRVASGPRRYRPSEHFERDDVLSHPRFGQGVVRRVRGANIEVDFEGPTGLKTLRHSRS